ncbi:MAG: SDR family oxidoreductase [Myxococcales bacterium]|nr:SDR family oxidoreductase [Myxococcales bacterium]
MSEGRDEVRCEDEPAQPGSLAARAFIVTGGGRGIGRATALCLAERGACVLVNDLGCEVDGSGSDPGFAEAVVAEIAASGGRAVASCLDASRAENVAALLQRSLDHFGRFDGAVAAAGIRRDRRLLKMSSDDLEALVQTHLYGAFHLIRVGAEHLRAQRRGGSIVLMAASSAFFGARSESNLAASSAAVVALARSASAELRKDGIRINCVVPTARTRQTEGSPLLRDRLGTTKGPEHVAPLVAFLLSEAAAKIHGEVLGVAGPRIYGLHGRETTGAFAPGGRFEPHAILDSWDEITRG